MTFHLKRNLFIVTSIFWVVKIPFCIFYFSNIEFFHLTLISPDHVLMYYICLFDFMVLLERIVGREGFWVHNDISQSNYSSGKRHPCSGCCWMLCFAYLGFWDPTDEFLEGCVFSSSYSPIEQGSLSPTFSLLAPAPPFPPKYTLTLGLGLYFPKHILKVSFTDCFATLQMAQHFVDERV